MQHSLSSKTAFIFSFIIGFLFLSLIATKLSFWDANYFQIINIKPTSSLFLLSLTILLLFGCKFVKYKRLGGFANFCEPKAFGWVLLLAFFSDWICKRYSFLPGPSIRGEAFLLSILFWILYQNWQDKIFYFLAISTPLFLSWSFLNETQGLAIFTDDHPSFMYRLEMLRQNFPSIPFYGPHWNAGSDVRDFFGTGAINLFLLAQVFLRLFPIDKCYSYIVLAVILFLLPASTYGACKILKFKPRIACLSSILVVTTSLIWYRWNLKYGAMGFITASCLVPLNLALVIKFIDKKEELQLPEAVLFVFTCSLMFLWPLTVFIFTPLFCLAILNLKKIFKKRFTLSVILALIIINLPWMLLFSSVSKVTQFIKPASSLEQYDSTASYSESPANSVTKTEAPQLAREKLHWDAASLQQKQANFTLDHLITTVKNYSISTNLLILFLTLPGLFLLHSIHIRVAYFTVCIWLLF